MENDKPIIAILGGTGNQGPGLAMRWANAGYKIIIGSRQAEKAQATAKELNNNLGVNTIEGLQNQDAARQADISILTVLQSAHQTALESLQDALQSKILVDATARVQPPKFTPPEPPSAGRIAQNILGAGVRVVTAYQNVPASSLMKRLDQPVAADVLICADDLEAAETIIELTEAAGMGAYFAGGLDAAIVVEGLTSLLLSMNKHYRGHGTIRVAGIDKSTAS